MTKNTYEKEISKKIKQIKKILEKRIKQPTEKLLPEESEISSLISLRDEIFSVVPEDYKFSEKHKIFFKALQDYLDYIESAKKTVLIFDKHKKNMENEVNQK